MAETITSVALAAAAKSILERSISIAAASTQEVIKTWSDKAKAKRISQSIAGRVKEFSKVKTIWQIDREVDLAEFFVPPMISIDGGQEKKFETAADVNFNDGNILIEGMPGHGKSILMRQLALTCLQSANRIPIFIQLRDIDSSHSLEQKIIATLHDMGIPNIDASRLNSLLQLNLFALFLDGFDELQDSFQNQSRQYIESLAKIHQTNLPIVITTRTNETIEYSTGFRRGRFLPVSIGTQEQLLQKLVRDDKDRLMLWNAIRQNRGDVSGLLCTPLMMVILIVVFHTERKVPETFSEFYEHLFWTLLQRHDGTKPGFSRARKTKLGASEFRKLFETFCYCLRKGNIGATFTQAEGVNAIGDASKLMSITLEPIDYLTDVKKVTGLLLEESLKWHFVHRTIQEYFCAAYIASREDNAVKAFYKKRMDREYAPWLQELQFLRKLDAVRFYRHFYLPRANLLLEQLESEKSRLSKFPSIWDNVLVMAERNLWNQLPEIRYIVKMGCSFVEFDYIVNFFLPRLRVLSIPSSAFQAPKQNSTANNTIDLIARNGTSKKSSMVKISEFAAMYSVVKETLQASADALHDFKIRIAEANKLIADEDARRESLL